MIPTPLWRPATPADLPGIVAIAARVHPDFPESAAVFADRIRLYPPGAALLERNGAAIGYLISHPWRADSIPPLDTMLHALPPEPDVYYLHDLALLPEARGGGAAARIVAKMAGHAATAGFAAMRLVAVNGSVPFWQRQGFEVEPPGIALAAKLASYGPEARLMTRRLEPIAPAGS